MSLYLTSFISGAAIMVVELTASRLLAPFFGASLYVWTNVIGVIMVALAIGYWLGGRLAERTRSRALLSRIILAAGLASAIIPFALTAVARSSTGSLATLGVPGSLIIFLGSFFALLTLFALPVFLLGMVSPFVIRLLTLNNPEVGAVAGRVYGISTAGSILGTFLPALLLVPAVGSRKTLLLAAAALLLLAAAHRAGRRRILPAVLFLPLAVSSAFLPAVFKNRQGLVMETESPYQYISVQDEPEWGRTLRYNEGSGVQSVNSSGVYRGFYYWDYAPALLGAVGGEQPGGRRDLFILGLAGGTVAELTERSWGDRVKIRGAEIDPAVVEIGKRYFSLNQVPGLETLTADGRMALEQDKKLYDLILVDAYSNQLYIPPHLATVEFFRLAASRLKPGGAVAANVVAPSAESLLLKRLTRTLQEVFPAVALYNIPGSWNHLLLAGATEVSWKDLPNRVPESIRGLAMGISEAVKNPPRESVPPLTDDDAPVEFLTDAQVFEILKTRSD